MAFSLSLASYFKAVDEAMRVAIRLEGSIAAGLAAVEAEAMRVAEAKMAKALQEALARGDLLGRAEAVKAARSLGASIPRVAPTSLPRVPFLDAVSNIISREPILAESAEAVAQAYSERHVFALAKSSAQHVTERAQKAVADVIHKGWTVDEGVSALLKIAEEDAQHWTRAYAETVVRTNTATAAAEGRIMQAQEPAIRVAIGGLEYITAGDSNVRANHRAMDGLVASQDDPVWNAARPPLGHNCRCGLRYVGWPELQRRGLLIDERTVRLARIPPGGGPDPGFRRTA